MLPIACLMSRELPFGCINVNFESFLGTGNKTTLPNALGLYCQTYYSTKGLKGTWIGTAAQGIRQCIICCIRRDEDRSLHYSVTTAPRKFPCGEGKAPYCTTLAGSGQQHFDRRESKCICRSHGGIE
uniref:Putative ixostatin n=1 Tax=Ixodes ricinus TaxID=34613 RepID=A0A0K8R4H6_IXORI